MAKKKPTQDGAAVSAPPKKKRNENWRGLLQFTTGRTPSLIQNSANVALILNHHEDWEGVFVFDEFIGDIVAVKLPPWPKDIRAARHVIADWTHDDTVRLAMWLSREEKLHVPAHVVGEALRIVAQRKTVHPVRDFLGKTKWNRTKLVDQLFIRGGGAEDTPYNRAVAANFMISAVARVMDPGCKVDTMPILEGVQGLGKSTLLHDLFGAAWFSDTPIDIGSKDGYQALRRKWGAEMAELDSLNKGETTAVKGFLSTRVDRYRPSYGKDTIDFPRQIVFAGTTNADTYLKDDTGARRFWPVKLVKADLEWIRSNREQLWAEAFFRYRKGEKWYFTDEALIEAAAEITEERRQTDPWEHVIGKWLAEQPRVRVRGVTTSDVLLRALELAPDRLSRYEETRAGQVLRACGFTRTARERRDGTRQRVYYPSDGPLGIVENENAGKVHEPISRTKLKTVGPGRTTDGKKTEK